MVELLGERTLTPAALVEITNAFSLPARLNNEQRYFAIANLVRHVYNKILRQYATINFTENTHSTN